MREVVIIDSGGANLASLQFALERLGTPARVSADAQAVGCASHVILPGVGSALDAMRRLRAAGLATPLARLEQPVLGICLGMQLLFSRSDEGPAQCLGILPETVHKLAASDARPVPHMGWNQLALRAHDPLLDGIRPHDYVYFVHSYAAAVSKATVASCTYGEEIAAVVRAGNFWGTQFHPERSGPTGARILANFLRLGS
ncbi:MAG TPA: imidazole glycerol phosphate synthase subunit HisH [Steroidobacteraceae bacterium]|nr:imidazole glycerol phosphate synthase subunit HisH [Steroidobacteraceae bacterium]